MDPELISASKTKKQSVLEYLPKLGNYLLGISIICYISGFIITNLYLGSLGIVNLEIIRSRYILTGFLFLLFSGSIIYLAYGLLKTLQKYREKPLWNTVLLIVWYSIINLVIVYVVMRVLSILAGSTNNPPIGLPQLTPITPWKDWINTVPSATLYPALILFGWIFALFILISALFILANPKDKSKERQTRKQLFVETVKGIWDKKYNFILSLLGIYIFFYLWSLFSNALNFMVTNRIDVKSTSSPTQIFSFPTEIGWSQYFYSIVIIYAIFGLFIISLSLLQKSGAPATDGNPLAKSQSLIYFISAAIIFIVPTYTLRVYPNIPQQIGGGEIIRVEAQISNTDLSKAFSEQNTTTYLVDRTARTSIFYLINNVTKEYKIQEIQNDLILSITYNP